MPALKLNLIKTLYLKKTVDNSKLCQNEINYACNAGHGIFTYCSGQNEIDYLNYLQPIAEVHNSKYTKDNLLHITSYYGNRENQSIVLHYEMYRRFFRNTLEVKEKKWCPSTLSFRTVLLDDKKKLYFKYGMPYIYGGTERFLRKHEILRSIYISDYVKSLDLKNNLIFFQDFKGYIFPHLPNRGALFRTIEQNDVNVSQYLPLGNAFHKFLTMINKAHKDEYETILFEVLSRLLLDLQDLIHWSNKHGVTFEFHGQNLLVKNGLELNEKNWTYLYRDYGNCYTDLKSKNKAHVDLLKYYKSKYSFSPVGHKEALFAGSWRILRGFYIDNILYIADQNLKRIKSSKCVYKWFSKAVANSKLNNFL